MAGRPSKQVKEPREHVHTTLSSNAIEILDRYENATGKNGEKIFGNKARVIERALEVLDEQYNPEKGDKQSTWERARDELNMVLVGKRTFLSYISGDFKKAFKENIAVEIIEWFKGKPVSDLTIDEILHAIMEIWTAANYFYKTDMETSEGGVFRVYLYHDFHEKRFSEYWGTYFKELLFELKHCNVEIFPRSELLILRVDSCGTA
nr:hypothetical protein [Candidatus Sigynarchaeota archaeon]